MGKTPEEKLAELQSKKREIERQIRSISAKEAAAKRKADTRRKILAGAAVLANAERSPENHAELMRLLDKFLIQDRDRAVFGLPPKEGK